MKSEDIRRYFLIKKNFKMVLHLMGDLRHIYDEQKYPMSFENRVYDILFYRVLMDRIYFEKDNPKEEDDQDQSFLENYDTFIHEAKEGPVRKRAVAVKKAPVKMIDIEEIGKKNIDDISTRELLSIAVKCEHDAEKADAKTSKEYKNMAKKYQDAYDQRQKDLHSKIMSHIDKDGRWISNPK